MMLVGSGKFQQVTNIKRVLYTVFGHSGFDFWINNPILFKKEGGKQQERLS